MQNVQEQYDHIFKIVVIGRAGVGKTSIKTRFIDHTFSERITPTLGPAFHQKDLDCEGKLVKLQIYEASGSNRYKTTKETSIN